MFAHAVRSAVARRAYHKPTQPEPSPRQNRQMFTREKHPSSPIHGLITANSLSALPEKRERDIRVSAWFLSFSWAATSSCNELGLQHNPVRAALYDLANIVKFPSSDWV